MATTFYFHDATNAAAGTYPTGEQSATTPTWSSTGATTLRTMNTFVGSLQASRPGTSASGASTQSGFLGYFVSPPLGGVQKVGGGSMTLATASTEANVGMNFNINGLNIYVWRPSTGTKVGTIRDSAGTSLGGIETGLVETTNYITGITSTAVTAGIGDVIVCEVWATFTQAGSSPAYATNFYYDGTTAITADAIAISSAASYIRLSENLIFQNPIGTVLMSGFSSTGGFTIN